MRTTIDKAGRLVVPKQLRDRLGIEPGAHLDMVEDGAGLRIDLVTSEKVLEVDGHLLIEGEAPVSDEDVRELRLADQQ